MIKGFQEADWKGLGSERGEDGTTKGKVKETFSQGGRWAVQILHTMVTAKGSALLGIIAFRVCSAGRKVGTPSTAVGLCGKSNKVRAWPVLTSPSRCRCGVRLSASEPGSRLPNVAYLARP